jgi:hypothetical protein
MPLPPGLPLIATGCYTNLKSTYPGAISISVSAPRWFGSIPSIRKLAPSGFKNDPIPSYVPKYKALLADQDPRAVINDATELVYQRAKDMGYDDDSAATFTPVLLCWERPGQFCHRRMVADWIAKALEIDVPEVKLYSVNQLLVVPQRSNLAKPPASPITQTSLF